MKTILLASIVFLMATPALSLEAPAGASLAWTSNDPIVVRAREMILRGELSKAAEYLHLAQTAGQSDEVAIDETLEIIRRIRLLYSVDGGEKRSIPKSPVIW